MKILNTNFPHIPKILDYVNEEDLKQYESNKREVLILKKSFHDLENAIRDIEMIGTTHPGGYMFSLLQKANVR